MAQGMRQEKTPAATQSFVELTVIKIRTLILSAALLLYYIIMASIGTVPSYKTQPTKRWNTNLNHSHKKRKDSLQTPTEPAVFSL